MTSSSKFGVSETRRFPLTIIAFGPSRPGKSSFINSVIRRSQNDSISNPPIYPTDTPGIEDKRRDKDFIEIPTKGWDGDHFRIKILEKINESRRERTWVIIRQHPESSLTAGWSSCRSTREKFTSEDLQNLRYPANQHLDFLRCRPTDGEELEFDETIERDAFKPIFEDIQFLSRDAERFESLEIQGRCARQRQLDYLFSVCEQLIPRLTRLKEFRLNLFDSDLTNENVQKLAWSLREIFGELEKFYCNLSQTKVTEKAIIQFFHEMPSMKNFELNIGNCVFTDYGMKILIRNSLKSMSALEYLNLDFQGTDATSSQITDLFRNIPLSVKTVFRFQMDKDNK